VLLYVDRSGFWEVGMVKDPENFKLLTCTVSRFHIIIIPVAQLIELCVASEDWLFEKLQTRKLAAVACRRQISYFNLQNSINY
jgi:hypothetical protein